jgi:hypothetical protein
MRVGDKFFDCAGIRVRECEDGAKDRQGHAGSMTDERIGAGDDQPAHLFLAHEIDEGGGGLAGLCRILARASGER